MSIFKYPSLAGKISQRVQAEKRMALSAPYYPAVLDYEHPVREIKVTDIKSNVCTIYVLFHCRKRRDMWRVTKNGHPWKPAIGYSHIMAEIRKAR